MNKFRKTKQEISVNGKLPTDAIMPILSAFIQSVQYNTTERQSELFRANLTEFRHNFDDKKEISIVESKKSTVKITNDSTLVSTGFLLEGVDLLIELKKNAHALKLLDVIAYIVESSSQVFKVNTKHCARTGSYRNRQNRYPVADNRLKFPFLSKRFEKTSFLHKAKTLYIDEFNTMRKTFLDDWTLNHNLYKQHTPLKVLLSETLIVRKLNGAQKQESANA